MDVVVAGCQHAYRQDEGERLFRRAAELSNASECPCTTSPLTHVPSLLRERNRAAFDPTVPPVASLVKVAVLFRNLPPLPALDLSQSLPGSLEDVDVPVVVGWKPDLNNTYMRRNNADVRRVFSQAQGVSYFSCETAVKRIIQYSAENSCHSVEKPNETYSGPTYYNRRPPLERLETRAREKGIFAYIEHPLI